MFFSFLDHLVPQKTRTAGRSMRSRLRPQLETLEDRLVPARTSAVFDPTSASWYLHDHNAAGAPTTPVFRYGAPGWHALLGDWDGNGTNTVGVFDPATATWYLKNSNSSGAPDIAPFRYGAPGWIPVVGDWDGNGTTTIGVVDPST